MLNGKSTHILGLGAISPLLLLSRGVHTEKIRVKKRSVADGDPKVHESTDEDAETDQEDGKLAGFQPDAAARTTL